MGAGKWIGGIIGFMAGGPLGALAGYALGSLIDFGSNPANDTTATATNIQKKMCLPASGIVFFSQCW